MDELVEELLHASATKGHLEADDLALAHLELRDRLLGSARCCLLASDACETVLNERLLGLVCLTDTGRHDDLEETRRGVHVRIAELTLEGVKRVRELFFGHHHTECRYARVVPLLTATRTFLPSLLVSRLTRVPFFSFGSWSITFEIEMARGFSTMRPV